jgi:hypothetical protein
MPEQTTGGKISFLGILGIVAFSLIVWFMISNDYQKQLYLLVTLMLSGFLLMIAFDIWLEHKPVATAAVTEPPPTPVLEPKPVAPPAARGKKGAQKRR